MLSQPRPIEYPTSDGVPLGETDTHRNQIIDLIGALEDLFSDSPDVYVSGNLLMLYEEGNRNAHRSPDVLVALGVAKKARDHYLIWEEGKAPDFIIEVTSKSTRLEDIGEKKGLYAALGVREYVIFDPLRDYLEPQLKMYRLEQGEYVPVIGEPLQSTVLNLDLKIMESRLRLVDRRTGELLSTREETRMRAQRETAARTAAEAALAQAEEAFALERAALLAEVERLRGLRSD
ncbi:MAG: Uma2 family endonuclease [Armatimonadetes bacterium]|nr:Uma2 family endonuclease [Armatimonadota bacterium]